jgi:hypothetical protein
MIKLHNPYIRRKNCDEMHISFPNYYLLIESWDSGVGIATGYGLDDQEVGIRVPVRQEFSLSHVVQTGYGVHPAFYPLDTEVSFPGRKAAGKWN